MSASLYEIVELPNGDIVLRRADEKEGEPMVSIHFSDDSLPFLRNGKFEIAKAMIEAGMEMVGELADQEIDEVNFELDAPSRTIH